MTVSVSCAQPPPGTPPIWLGAFESNQISTVVHPGDYVLMLPASHPQSEIDAACQAYFQSLALKQLSCVPQTSLTLPGTPAKKSNGVSLTSDSTLTTVDNSYTHADSTSTYFDASSASIPIFTQGFIGGMWLSDPMPATDRWTVNAAYTVSGPQAPTGLSVGNYSDGIHLSWTINSTTELGVRVYRDGAVIVTLAPGSASYVDMGGLGGTHVYYVVVFDANGESAPTNAITVNGTILII
jgi:hypothetical protein